jgi:mersacidin/lichenicidin family type 2 lantibiotic
MKFDMIRAWKDETYRSSLSQEQQALLPENPVGTIELEDADLEIAYGGGQSDSNSGTCLSVAGNCNSVWGNCFSMYANFACNINITMNSSCNQPKRSCHTPGL